jgi:hypothetical protein
MRHLKEALVFKTDEERLEWFQSLAPEERAEVVRDIQEIINNIAKALGPVVKALQDWVHTFVSNMDEVGSSFAQAQARVNNSCTGLASPVSADDDSTQPASQ